MFRNTCIYILFCLSVFSVSCKKSKPADPYGSVRLQVSHRVDEKAVFWDSLMYRNAAGNTYSLQQLQYFLSDVTLYRNGKPLHYADTVWYIDGRQSLGTSMLFRSIPVGYYDSVSFVIGLSTERNKSFTLVPTMEHSRMAWPEEMGGGYHFLKLEGHWLSSDSAVSGYAIHLGKSGFEVRSGCRIHLDVGSESTAELPVTMNINEWFQIPRTYDLSADGVYTMGNEKLMRIIAENGVDVFKSIK